MIDRVLVATKRTAYDHYTADHDELDRVLSEDELETVRDSHNSHYESLRHVEDVLDAYDLPYEEVYVPREQVASPDADLVITVGGDGTLLNTAHHIPDDTPILPLRSDDRSHGALTTANTDEIAPYLDTILAGTADHEDWTRLVMEYDDTTEIALNEVFLGAKYSVEVARYDMQHGDETATHYDSGLILSTGAGSTGWYANVRDELSPFPRDDPTIRYVTREPMRHSDDALQHGTITPDEDVTITSKMNVDGVISVDGDTDHRLYDFPRGETVTLRVADHPLHVVTNPG